jgi:hypothetical protein
VILVRADKVDPFTLHGATMTGRNFDSNNMPLYGVDSDAQLTTAFPKDIAPPQLLFDFAAWLRNKPWGSVGCFDVTAAEQIDKLLPLEADQNNHFAMCIWLPDGGLAGFWFKDTRDAMQAPWVHMDSEGQFSVLAPNFALFLQRLSQARFDSYHSGSDFLPRALDADDEDQVPPDLTASLAAWLAVHPVASSVLASASPSERAYEDDGQAQAWLDQLCNDIEAAKQADPHMRQLIAVVAQHQLHRAGKSADWSVESYRIFAAADTMVIRRGGLLIAHGDVDKLLTPLTPDAQAALTPPLFALRQALAQRKKGLGLWPSATLSIFNNGALDVQPNYDHAFAIGFAGFQARDFAADQARYPRTTSKLADWHLALIQQGAAA